MATFYTVRALKVMLEGTRAHLVCAKVQQSGVKGWAICRVPWGEALLSLPPAKEQHDCTTGQVLSRGLSSKIGLFNGPISRLCPHAVSGQPYQHACPALPCSALLCPGLRACPTVHM